MREYQRQKKISAMTYEDFVDFFKKVPHETAYYAETFGRYVFERHNVAGVLFFRVVLNAHYVHQGEVYVEDPETGTEEVVDSNYLRQYEPVEK